MTIFDRDPHSYYEPGQPRMTHLDWTVEPSFVSRTLKCTAVITFDRGGKTYLDTRDLEITSFGPLVLSARDPILGSRLTVNVPDDDHKVTIRYKTSPKASGLQWLAPEQTGGKEHPFLFSQGEEIHARSYVPCQDTPSVKFTFTVHLKIPRELRGLMAANKHLGTEEDGTHRVEHWEMDRPIPEYLLALAVGDLVSKDLSERSRVWAEPGMVDAAAKEFVDLPRIMNEAERLFGKYPWGRYDVLVLPYSFPYGGMENPCLSFLTPAIITGDGSGVSTLIHELAHSWTGNLVSNATWRDFWLNEGWTVYAEWRISEVLYGRDVAELGKALLAREFERDVAQLAAKRPLLTALAPDIAGMDPDDAFSRVPYFKGAMFLLKLEKTVGREAFDAVIRRYIERFKFTSITTLQFLDFLLAELPPGTLERVRAWEWVYEAGMPSNAPPITSTLITEVCLHTADGSVPSIDRASRWKPQQWALYLDSLPRPVSIKVLAKLDQDFGLQHAPNADVQWAYLLLAVESGYGAVNETVQAFLCKHGRIKYLKPLYRALCATEKGKIFARQIFDKAHSGYHPIAATQVERILAEAKA